MPESRDDEMVDSGIVLKKEDHQGARMQLSSITLRRLLAERLEEVQLDPPFSSAHESSVQVSSTEGTAELVVTDLFEITNAADDAQVARVEIVQSAIFQEVAQLTPGSSVERDLVLEARLITYPSMRDRLMNLVVAMGMPPLILPIVTRADIQEDLDLESPR